MKSKIKKKGKPRKKRSSFRRKQIRILPVKKVFRRVVLKHKFFLFPINTKGVDSSLVALSSAKWRMPQFSNLVLRIHRAIKRMRSSFIVCMQCNKAYTKKPKQARMGKGKAKIVDAFCKINFFEPVFQFRYRIPKNKLFYRPLFHVIKKRRQYYSFFRYFCTNRLMHQWRRVFFTMLRRRVFSYRSGSRKGLIYRYERYSFLRLKKKRWKFVSRMFINMSLFKRCCSIHNYMLMNNIFCERTGVVSVIKKNERDRLAFYNFLKAKKKELFFTRLKKRIKRINRFYRKVGRRFLKKGKKGSKSKKKKIRKRFRMRQMIRVKKPESDWIDLKWKNILIARFRQRKKRKISLYHRKRIRIPFLIQKKNKKERHVKKENRNKRMRRRWRRRFRRRRGKRLLANIGFVVSKRVRKKKKKNQHSDSKSKKRRYILRCRWKRAFSYFRKRSYFYFTLFFSFYYLFFFIFFYFFFWFDSFSIFSLGMQKQRNKKCFRFFGVSKFFHGGIGRSLVSVVLRHKFHVQLFDFPFEYDSIINGKYRNKTCGRR